MDEREFLCEVCGKTETLDTAEAYAAGWDYPPFIGVAGVVSPRTCGDCTIENTAYWAIITKAELTEKHLATIRRIQAEVEDGEHQDGATEAAGGGDTSSS